MTGGGDLVTAAPGYSFAVLYWRLCLTNSPIVKCPRPEMEPGLRVTGQRVSDLGTGRVGSRVKVLTRLFEPDSCHQCFEKL